MAELLLFLFAGERTFESTLAIYEADDGEISGRRKPCFWLSRLRDYQVVSKAGWLIMQTLTIS